MTLAQVFFFKDTQGQPERFYLVATGELSIKADFSGFGKDIAELRKRLRAKRGIELFETFSTYAARFRQQVNVRSEQAWKLFHQTVSMKTVGNLTEFVQTHMLEEPQIEQEITGLIAHFEDLTRAHALVLKAKHQLQLLIPLVEDCDPA